MSGPSYSGSELVLSECLESGLFKPIWMEDFMGWMRTASADIALYSFEEREATFQWFS